MTRFVSTSSDALRLFGMANQLTEAELDRVEQQYDIDLGRRRLASAPERDETYYPQFDQAIRSEAARMAEHYEIFYCLERTIRTLVDETLKVEAGPQWWDAAGKVPQRIHDDVAARIQKEIDSAVTLRSANPIDFTTFGELGEIMKANWALFGATFDSQRAVEKVLANLNTLRAAIAHCCPLAEDEVLRLRLGVRDWFRLME